MNQAAPRTTAKHLHLGVIHGGRFLHEKIVTEQRPITVGPTKTATLAVPTTADVGEGFRLFEQAGNKYALAFTERMTGRVSVDNTDLDLQTLRQKGVAKKQGEVYLLPLVEKARGKIVLGDVCIVFNFTEAPKPLPKTALPLSVRSNIVGSWDWTFFTALASTFVVFFLCGLHISSIPVPEEITFDQIEDRFAKMIIPKKMELEKKPEIAKDKPAEKKEEKKDEKKKEEKPPEDDPEAKAQRKQEVQKKIANKGVLAILGAKGGMNGAVADVFKEGAAINGDIDSAFAGMNAIEVANGSNSTSRGTGGPGESSSIGKLETRGAGKVDMAEKAEVKVAAEVRTEAPDVDGSLDAADIVRVVKGRMSAIKECYERELKRNPKLAGKVVVRFTIDEEGRVTQTSIEDNTLGDKAVATCIQSRFERFRFPKPDGGAVTAAYPFIFAPSS